MTKTTEGFLPVTLRLPHTAVWKDEKALWRFMDLLFMCSFSDRKVRVGGKNVEVKRGEVIISRTEMCSRWRASRHAVETFLAMLVKDGLAEVMTDSTHTRRIRILSMSEVGSASFRPRCDPSLGPSSTRGNQCIESFSSASSEPSSRPNFQPTYTRNTNIRNYKKKENLYIRYIREKELDLEGKYNNPDNFLW